MIDFTETEKDILRTFLSGLGMQAIVDYTISVLPVLIAQSHPSVNDFKGWLAAKSVEYQSQITDLDNVKSQNESTLTMLKSNVDSLLTKF